MDEAAETGSMAGKVAGSAVTAEAEAEAEAKTAETMPVRQQQLLRLSRERP